MRRGVHDRARLGGHGLHQHAPVPTAAGTPGELGDQGEGALLGAEVREAQGGVGVDHECQLHVGEVVSLGDHLGSDQNAQAFLSRLEAAEDRGGTGVGGLRGARQDRVGVEAEDREVALVEDGGEVVGQPLGPGAVARHSARGAVRAAHRNRLAVPAVVAGEQPLGAVQNERHVAFRASPGRSTGAAGEEVRPARRFSSTIALAARSRTSASASTEAGCRVLGCPRMSSTSTGGSGRPSTRCSSREAVSRRALSGRGVALPSSSAAPARLARSSATSRAS